MRTDLVSFIRRSFRELSPTTTFAPSWHIAAIAWELERIRLGENRRLIINMPPRSLKSISASVAFPAFIHGHDPSCEIVCVSYAQDLAAKLHNDYRSLLTSSWYRSVFPRTMVGRKDSEAETHLTARGSRLATSVGGTLTGRGGDIIIIDDPLKPSDASSESSRTRTNEWFGSTLLSRQNDKRTAAIVIVSQRLHSNDLAGHVLENDGDSWTLLNLPAIAPRDAAIPIGRDRVHNVKHGDVLHPEREPRDVLDAIRREIGSDQFAAQYLQEPVPPGGNMFKRSWIRRYHHAPAQNEGRIIQSWDTAAKTGPQNDWSVCTTWQIINGCYYLLDVWRDKVEYPALISEAKSLAHRFNPYVVLVEDTNIGTALITELKAARVRTEPVQASQSKEARAAVVTAIFERGDVCFPDWKPWLAELEAELFAFPGGRHDDQVDSISQALTHAVRGKGGVAVSIRGYF
ncbi:phage terminase large subunit [Tianweitania sediminis]|uniref:phage terminase large subunit n=1 Tax=Tianweitania sediminis TaxID=1502156 RepID=UPI001FD85268|nr:phage terminase large subunit [Tianweitania sediminis]